MRPSGCLAAAVVLILKLAAGGDRPALYAASGDVGQSPEAISRG